MKKRIPLFCLLCILISFLNIFSPNPFQNQTKSIVLEGNLKTNTEKTPLDGCWVVTKYKMSDLFSLDNRKLKKSIGTTAIINNKNVILLGNVYKNPIFKTRTIPAKEYFNEYNINSSIFNIDKNKKVQVVDILGDNGSSTQVVKIEDNTLITQLSGIFFIYNKQS